MNNVTKTSDWNAPLLCPSRYEGRVGIITGGASGIGRATAIRMIREGGTVIVGDLNVTAGTFLMEEARSNGYGDQCRFLSCNVIQENDIVLLTKYAEKEFGRLDLMVNCAGAGGAIGKFLDTSTEDWDATFQLILNSVFWGTKAAAQTMIRLGSSGSIVNVSSIAAIASGIGGSAYSAAKAAVNSLTLHAAISLAVHRIRCNAVCPGTVITPLLLRGDDSTLLERASINSQIGHDVCRPEHVTSVILYLGNDQSKSVTGNTLMVTGGMHVAGNVLCEWQPYDEIVAG